jgi:hypothetical protein
MAVRFRRIRAGRRTRDVVSWTIGVVVVLALCLAIGALTGHPGWLWP